MMLELVGGNDNARHKVAPKVHECLSTIYALFVCFYGLSVRWSPLLHEHG
jgi:hypothetical protein